MIQVECRPTPRADDLPTFRLGRPPTGRLARPMPLSGHPSAVRWTSLVDSRPEVRFRHRPMIRLGRGTASRKRLPGLGRRVWSLSTPRRGHPTMPRPDPLPLGRRRTCRAILPPTPGARPLTPRHLPPRHPGHLPTTPEAAPRSAPSRRTATDLVLSRARVSPPDPMASTSVKPVRRWGRPSARQVGRRRTSVRADHHPVSRRPVTTPAHLAEQCRPSTFRRWAPDSTASTSSARASLTDPSAHCRVNTGAPPLR